MKTLSIFAALLSLSLVACSSQKAPVSVASGASCAKLDGSQATVSSLYEPGTIYQAEPIRERVFRSRAVQVDRVVGASLHVRAQPGMSAPYLERVLACHSASGQAAHPHDPLSPQVGALARLSVKETQFGFQVDVLGDSPESGADIWNRAAQLTGHEGHVAIEQIAAHSPIAAF